MTILVCSTPILLPVLVGRRTPCPDHPPTYIPVRLRTPNPVLNDDKPIARTSKESTARLPAPRTLSRFLAGSSQIASRLPLPSPARPLRLAPATEGNARKRGSERCERGATPVPVTKRAARERGLKVAAVEHAGAPDMARVAAKRRFARDATDFFTEQPRAFRSRAHVRAEFGRMKQLFVVAEAFRAQLEAFARREPDSSGASAAT
jgi:hypothetical protein